MASPTARQSSASAGLDRDSVWRADLAALVVGMGRLHPALEHSVSRSDLEMAAARLSSQIPTASDDQLLVGLIRIVAMVSSKGCDAHTGLYVWGEQTYAVDSLPLRLWWFDEGVYVVDALEPYRDLIGSTIEGIGTRRMSDVLAAIEPLVPRDNDMTVRLLMPRFLLIPQLLRGLGLIGPGSVDLSLSSGTGRALTVAVKPIAMREYNAWAGAYGLHLPADASVPYLSRIDDALWWQSLDGGATLFVQYNRVDRLPLSTVESLRSALHAPGVINVIIDARHNYGGEVTAATQLLDLMKDPAVDRPGHLFVITGRNTFSATGIFVARADAETSAVVVGESMSGCPTAYGNARSLDLPKTGLSVSVATLLEVGVSADDTRPTIAPELSARLTPAAWLARRDPALEAIRAYRP